MWKFEPRNTKFLVISACAGIVIVFTAAYSKTKPIGYHNDAELLEFRSMLAGDLPTGVNSLFIGSGKCGGCHGIDPFGIANVTDEGENVSAAENWRGTMMANSSKDPLWRAKVAHEVSVNPEHESALVNKCTSCHAPQGKYAALHDGIEDFTMAMIDEDSVANDGVACGACHSQQIESAGFNFSGELFYNADTVWGPVFNIQPGDFPMFSSAMQSFVGRTPVPHEKFSKSETCAGCHTLLTNTVNLDGELTGTQFIEQATYHEWLNSSYNAQDNYEGECQGCHMPRTSEPIVVASGYAFLEDYPREPYGQHWLVGGNTFMLGLLKNNIETLGLTANEDHFNTVIDRTTNQLQNYTATLEISEGEIDGDTARYTVKLTNEAGHKFPSGYPSRIAFVEFVMTDSDGNELFHSGKITPNFEIEGQDSNWEPHYDLITEDDQVQIYEMVMGDVNGNLTTVLERADQTLKDNRLVPLGFSTEHAAYDSTLIVGNAANDPNFNHLNGVEGSGTDEIRYHIPVSGIDGEVHVTAKLWYQTVPPKWTNELFSVDHPTINLFEEMYYEEGADPVQIALDETNSILTHTGIIEGYFKVSPNPTTTGQIQIDAGVDVIQEIRVHSMDGKLIESRRANGNRIVIQLPNTPGTYLLDVTTNRGRRIEKVLRK
ncbi:MAG: T9SS type A sorting domain-containing protein [Flavobacteriales bacterium]